MVTLDTTEPGLITNAFCEDCATISPDGGYGMYYLVAINGTAPSELAGPTSNDSSVMCTSLSESNSGTVD